MTTTHDDSYHQKHLLDAYDALSKRDQHSLIAFLWDASVDDTLPGKAVEWIKAHVAEKGSGTPERKRLSRGPAARG